MKNLIWGTILFAIGQTLIWFQTNGQFMWPWFKRNPLVLSIIGGTLASYIFIKATALIANYHDGLLWPGRFIGFSVGILSFSLLTYFFLSESITPKTVFSLMLAFILICVQIFWK